LMAWGVRNITLVDNARVSFSNPVRQSLFEFADSVDGGKPKAVAAADRLKAIFPGVNSVGVDLTIPMPGHAVSATELPHVKSAVEKLTELISTHDVIFLLMDSRESRWLPTVIGVSMGKLVLNSALGFDTYLVMRYGALPTTTSSTITFTTSTQLELNETKEDTQKRVRDSKIGGSERLGCYFCNDVVAPKDSQKDRTLDQQCTVTRPGLAYLASALAVELMVSVLQHPLKIHAPHDCPTEISDPGFTALGSVPHQLRGFLTHFVNIPLVGHAYSKCTACSEIVINEYRTHGLEFLLEVFNCPLYLEQLTGLSQMASADVDWVGGEDEDDF